MAEQMSDKNKELLIEILQNENKSLKAELEHVKREKNIATSFNVYRDHAKTEVAALLGLPSTTTPIEIINQLRSIVAELEDLRSSLLSK